MKSILSLALAAVMGLALLTGCGPAAPASSVSGPDGSGAVSGAVSEPDRPQLPPEPQAPSSGELKLNKFSNVELSALSPNIRVERGEDWAVRYDLHNQESVTRAEVVGDTFYFSSAYQPTPEVDTKDCELVLLIPVGADLNNVSLSTAAGSIELFNLTVEDLSVKSVSGNVALTHVVSGSLRAESTSGTVTTTSCTAERARAESTSGAVKLDGTYQTAELSSVSGTCELYAEVGGSARLQTVSGDITAQAPFQQLSVKTLGPIVVNGEKHSGKEVILGEGSPALSIESVSGVVRADQNILVMIQ